MNLPMNLSESASRTSVCEVAAGFASEKSVATTDRHSVRFLYDILPLMQFDDEANFEVRIRLTHRCRKELRNGIPKAVANVPWDARQPVVHKTSPMLNRGLLQGQQAMDWIPVREPYNRWFQEVGSVSPAFRVPARFQNPKS